MAAEAQLTKARADLYRVLALLSELDRIVDPVPRGEVGVFRVQPHIPPSLPRAAPPEPSGVGPR